MIRAAKQWLARCFSLRGELPQDADFVVHRSRRKRRRFTFSAGKRWLRWVAAAACIGVFLFGAVNLVLYGVDHLRARQASNALREAYYATGEPTSTPAPTVQPTATPAPTAQPSGTTAPTATPPTRLSVVRYPGNYSARISSRFEKIRRQNRDIIGWLTIDGLIDEAVVQRDNEYYLDRDYRGYHNVNGAIFLDEGCDLSTRPYTLMLYGHNMKTGAIFGSLRNYENLTFYRSNPFVTFDTAYEDGRYVIFAVATVGVNMDSWRYGGFAQLGSMVIADREAALNTLLNCSIYRTKIDVNAQDQVLLLITCVENDDERRVVAARRIREDEDEEALRTLVQRTTKK